MPGLYSARVRFLGCLVRPTGATEARCE